ncbi:lytic murein transglycosylase [Vibrio genomosp. F10]|uniref:Lytic transglycosylase n=2 Tax=Vibrio genomosp. F10 TaxID=723171 RepID=A0A1B9QY08_9VIBR|nr:lytic murein transglycosylase [Vibrio genomosp. F10]OCH75019.1 lytic transglycosylase [Vibrio genomosp. F10]OEE31147.1 lytic transglycosylase [Vibrio genomosp. F10 str. ZF-129]OEE97663.1 lytic transglycosylase [Vibrio genomosp. F10 str. 9ZC157]OEF03971.1 lytic transglycosylase [Vibrio genomosp. F10 str. 9ZB36]OEF09754.1 lytic transglycosylase [Vibrio genomosp. F10 str. 9ZD137]
MKKILSVLLGLGLSCSAIANELSFEQYVEKLKEEAIEQGISPDMVTRAFEKVTFKPRAVTADRNQPEKKLTLDEYIPRAVPDWKVKQAKDLYNKHYADLKRIGDEYGVQPQYIVALWGVESNFGKFTGNYSVIDALTTLAYEGRREAFFRKEAMAALTILDEGHITPEAMKGSWAGAMGQCQFMPSSFLAFAADGNGDGKKDIWNTKADVFASTANYLSQSGWDDTYTWGRQVQVPESVDIQLQGRTADKGKYIQQWSELGITRYDGSPLPKLDTDIKAWLIMPDDYKGRTYLVYNNYNVLMKWNRSYYFALAVSHLADRITY